MELVNVYITNLQNALNEELKKRILLETQFQVSQHELETLKKELEKKTLLIEANALDVKKKKTTE